MAWQFLVILATVSIVAVSEFESHGEELRIQDEEAKARKYLEFIENEFTKGANQASLVRWAYESNITEENLKKQVS
jgi:hypothetical protein